MTFQSKKLERRANASFLHCFCFKSHVFMLSEKRDPTRNPTTWGDRPRFPLSLPPHVFFFFFPLFSLSLPLLFSLSVVPPLLAPLICFALSSFLETSSFPVADANGPRAHAHLVLVIRARNGAGDLTEKGMTPYHRFQISAPDCASALPASIPGPCQHWRLPQ